MRTFPKVFGAESRLFILAVLAAQVIGGLVTQMSPLIIGGVIVGFNLSEQQAGLIVFAEFFLLSATAIAVAPFLPRIRIRVACAMAAGVAVLFQLISMFLTDYYLVAIVRCIAGVGVGFVYAASLAAIGAHSKNPDQVYGYVQVTWALLSVVLFSVGGHLTEQYNHQGIYALILFLSFLLMPCLKFMPEKIAVTEDGIEKENSGNVSNLWGCLTLMGIFMYLTASAAIYTFSAPLGERSGLTTSQIGYALTAGSGIGFTGAVAASWLNVKFGRATPITAFSLAFCIIALVLCLNTNPLIFVLALIFSVVFFYFSVPYLFGLAAALDVKGRWAAAAGSAYLLGFAAGPGLAGTSVEWVGYPGLGIVCVASALMAWVLLISVVRQIGDQTSHK